MPPKNRPMPRKGPPPKGRRVPMPGPNKKTLQKGGARSKVKNAAPTKKLPPKHGAPHTLDKGVKLKRRRSSTRAV